jgi:peroxiredoxin Q/BCP
MLKVGDVAPDFDAETSLGTHMSSRALRGRMLVLYFFPKAFTPNCTAEAKLFRDNYPELRALGAEVIGVSIDDLKTQCRFADEHQVSFPLVGDPDRHISRSFGVLWPLISLDKRVTFVVDEQGMIQAVFRHELQVSKHLDDVLHFLQKRVR